MQIYNHMAAADRWIKKLSRWHNQKKNRQVWNECCFYTQFHTCTTMLEKNKENVFNLHSFANCGNNLVKRLESRAAEREESVSSPLKNFPGMYCTAQGTVGNIGNFWLITTSRFYINFVAMLASFLVNFQILAPNVSHIFKFVKVKRFNFLSFKTREKLPWRQTFCRFFMRTLCRSTLLYSLVMGESSVCVMQLQWWLASCYYVLANN